MREAVPFLDTNAMEWAPGELHGQFTKMLSHDPETGARTALQRIDPSSGYGAPAKPHYHSGDEEIFVVDGKFSFDGENWLGRYSYCFHPTHTVHGFKSEVAEESFFLSKIKTHLDFNFSEEYRDLVPFNLDGIEPERGVSVIGDPMKQEWQDVAGPDGTTVMRRLILSRHPGTGEGAMLVQFMPGFVSEHGPHYHTSDEEVFVMEGEMETTDGVVFGPGCYTYKPAGTVQSPLRSTKGAICYVLHAGNLDFVPAGNA
ncbi:cupin domain-containing protein [Novosphingobium sp. BL-52-GroH]|uniref:cupin domain-containing protein n=1 Tax=Novosphingobium sp. BL-52-GroH TaxID=3349877 RepID=UPI00384D020B